jgi:MFS family permease
MGYTAAAASEAQYIALIVISIGMLITAWLGDRFPRRIILGAGGLLLLVLAVPFFSAAADRSVSLNLLFVMAGIVASLVNGTMAGVVADLFPTRIRFSGVAVSFNLAFSIFSGIAPLAAVELVKVLASPTGPAYYMCLCGAITFVCSLFLRRYEGHVGQQSLVAVDAAAQPSSLPVR